MTSQRQVVRSSRVMEVVDRWPSNEEIRRVLLFSACGQDVLSWTSQYECESVRGRYVNEKGRPVEWSTLPRS
jgi:hypothetical protein